MRAKLDFTLDGMMSHFGVLSYKSTGHLNPFLALSRRLVDMGHRVTFFQKPELESRIREYGLDFVPIAQHDSSRRKLGARDNGHKNGSTMADMRRRVKLITDELDMLLRKLPAAVSQVGIDALIIDEIVLPGPTVAEVLRLPYFIVSAALPHRFGWTVRGPGAGRSTPTPFVDRVHNRLLQVSVFRMKGPTRRKLDNYRLKAGLGPIRKIQMAFPELAHIVQLPECLDFPRSMLPDNFYHTGPFVDDSTRPTVQFPWNRLDGRPLIYASLGTAQNTQPAIFRMISEACHALNLQLVISLGGRSDPIALDELAGQPLVVRYAPQLELLKRVAVVVTHGGLNTVLETLMEGKPMIAIPMAYDQPAIASRLAWLKIAEVLPLKMLSAERLGVALTKLLNDASYRKAAMEIRSKIRSGRGLERAVEVIEEAMVKFSGHY